MLALLLRQEKEKNWRRDSSEGKGMKEKAFHSGN